jgi:uncharacterized protein (DUF58 family)
MDSIKIPVFEKGKFNVDYGKAIGEFEHAMKKFPVKNILYKVLFVTRGLEFDSFRKYESSDDANLIDWKASLRGSSLLIRKYIEEQDLKIYFVVDVSNSMLFGSGDKLKSEYVSELVISLAHLISGSGDKFGLVLYSDKINHFLRANNTKNHFGIAMDVLKNVENYGGGYDFGLVLDFLLSSLSQRENIFIFVSDFIGLGSGFKNKLFSLSSHHESLAFIVRDPLDNFLPENMPYQLDIQDPFSENQVTLDSNILNESYNSFVKERLKSLNDLFLKGGIDSLQLVINEPFSFKLASFLKSRAKGERT